MDKKLIGVQFDENVEFTSHNGYHFCTIIKISDNFNNLRLENLRLEH